jgi:hypothetical protein
MLPTYKLGRCSDDIFTFTFVPFNTCSANSIVTTPSSDTSEPLPFATLELHDIIVTVGTAALDGHAHDDLAGYDHFQVEDGTEAG